MYLDNISNMLTDGGGGLVTKSCLTFVTPWTVAHQAPLSMGFPRQQYWSELPFPSPRGLLDLEIEPMSPTWQVGKNSLPLSPQSYSVLPCKVQ